MAAFTTAAPYALTGTLGLSATHVGLTFVATSVGFAAGSLLATRLPLSLSCLAASSWAALRAWRRSA